MSPRAALSSVIFAIYVIIDVESSFYQSLCFPAKEQIEASTLSIFYDQSIQNLNATPSYLFTTNTECLSATIFSPDINSNLYDCFTCTVDISLNVTEDIRWSVLYAMNQNISTIIENVDISVSDFSSGLSYISYTSADPAEIDPRCANLVYPRICRLDLRRLSILKVINSPIIHPFYFSMSMNTNTQRVFYEISYWDGTNGPFSWIGVGFGEIGMLGDSYIYSAGFGGGEALIVRDYNLIEPQAFPGVNLDIGLGGTDDVENTMYNATGDEFTFSFDRWMDTQDINDEQYNGTELGVYIFAAVSIPDGVTPGTNPPLANHGSGNLVRSAFALFVPSPDESDMYWCNELLVGDCIIELSNIVTTTPSPTTTTSSIFSTEPTASTTAETQGTPAPTDAALDISIQIKLSVVFIVVLIMTLL